MIGKKTVAHHITHDHSKMNLAEPGAIRPIGETPQKTGSEHVN